MENDFSDMDKKTFEEMKKIVLARLRASSSDFVLLIGSKEYSKDELLQSVEEETKVGKEVIEAQIQFLRDLASGALYT